MVDEINDTIPIVLEQLGRASKVSRVHLFENHVDAAGGLRMSQRFEWAPEDIRQETGSAMLHNISYKKSGLERWIELMCKGRVVVGHTRTFPLTEQKSLVARGVLSILVVPIPVGSDWWGYIAFDVCRSEREWSVAEIDAFKTAADTIGAAIMRRRAEEKVQASLKEKELLLQEIHHRVKNNLQIISSLLDMSSMRIADIQAVHFFEDARDKIHSMALIHSQLYRSDRFDRIDMRDHIQELLNYLSYIYDKRCNITPIVHAEDVHLSINQAIPCTLILNELISNAYKHAFKDEQKGSIEISMKVVDNLFILSIRDNGDGFPAGMDVYKTDSLGLKLVRNLVQKQLRGRVEILQTEFTEFVIQFEVIQEEERYAQDTRR